MCSLELGENIVRIALITLLLAGCTTCPTVSVPKPVVVEKQVQIPFADFYFDPCPAPAPLKAGSSNGELLENYAALKNQIACLQTRLDTLRIHNGTLKATASPNP